MGRLTWGIILSKSDGIFSQIDLFRRASVEKNLLNPWDGSGEPLPGCQSLTMTYLCSVAEQPPASGWPQVKGVKSRYIGKNILISKAKQFLQNLKF